MKVKEFILQVKVQHLLYCKGHEIWEQLNRLVKQYCAEYRMNEGRHGEVDRDEMDRHVVTLMEQVLGVDFTKERVLLLIKSKYELTMILLGYIPDNVKNKLEEKITPFTASIFVRFGLEIYPERDSFFYCYPPKILPVEPLIFDFVPKYIPPSEELYYHKLNLNDQSVEYLIVDIQCNPVLKIVGLQDNNIGPYGIERLFSVIKNYPNIEKVYLMGNPIADDGAMYIAHALQEQGCRLKKLDLNRGSREDATEIRSIGAIALAKALSNNRTITYLGLGYNQIGDEGAKAFAEYLLSRYIQLDLRLSRNNICSPEAGNALLKLVRKNCFITGMDLNDNEGLDPAIIEEIQKQVKDNFKTNVIVSESSAIESSSLVIKKIRRTDEDLANKLQTAVDEYFRCRKDVVQTPEELQANCDDIIGEKVSDKIMMFREIIIKLMKLYAERKELYSTEGKFKEEERLFRRMEWAGGNTEISEFPTDLQNVQQILPEDKPVLVNFKGNLILCLPRNWVECNVKVFGDIHGNVVAVDEIDGFLEIDPDNKVICLGDYIDRGDSLEVLERLAAIKAGLDDPSRLILLCGRHEQAHLTPENKEFSDALCGNFHRELIRGDSEQEIRVTDLVNDRRRCTIPLYGASAIRDRERLAEVSRAMFQSMPLGCFLPIANEKAILLTHGALLSIHENSGSPFEKLGDIKKLRTVYSKRASNKKLVTGLVEELTKVNCIRLVCGHSHHVAGSYGRTGRFRPKSTTGFIITVNSALVSCDAKQLYACALMIERGQIQKGFVEIPMPNERVIMDAMCCVGLENAAKDLNTLGFDLAHLLMLTHPSQRQHKAIYAMVKAVQIRDMNLAIDIGRVYLSTLKVDYLKELNSLIIALREWKLSNSAINRIKKGLSRSILLEQPKINVIKGPCDNIILRFPKLDLTRSRRDDLPDSSSIEKLQWHVEHSLQNVFQNMQEVFQSMKAGELTLEKMQQSKDEVGIDAVANAISNILCGIERPDELPTVTVKSTLNTDHNFRVLYSVPVANSRGMLQFGVTVQQDINLTDVNLTIEDVTVNVEQSTIIHSSLMPKIINGMLQRITDEINKELIHGEKRLVINLQRFNKSFMDITRCLLGKHVSMDMQRSEFIDGERNLVKIQFELTEPNKLPIPGVYDIRLTSTRDRTLRVDAVELGFQDRGRDDVPKPSRIIGGKLGKDPEDRSNNYSYLSLPFEIPSPLLRINLRKIGKELQGLLRSGTCKGDSRITTQIFFNDSSEGLQITGNKDERLKQGGEQIIKELQEQFEGRISDLVLRNAAVFIIADNESGAYTLFGNEVSKILQANGFMASFQASEYQYFINTIKPKEITIKFEVTRSDPLRKLDQSSKDKIQGKGYIEFCLAKISERTLHVTCTGLEFKTDPSTIMEYETYRTLETISDMLQISIAELNAVVAEINDVKSVKHINSCITCFIKMGEMEEEVEFATQFFRNRNQDSIDKDACIRYLRERGIIDPAEQAHFVVLLGDKSNALSYVYGSVMQEIIKELIGESYLYAGKSGTKVTYNSLEKTIEIFCPFQLRKEARKPIECLYNIRVIRSPSGALSLNKVELGIQNKRIARQIGSELEKSLEPRSNGLYYVTIFNTQLPPLSAQYGVPEPERNLFAIGNDANLATHGYSLTYWYSITDFYILLQDIRQRNLIYNNYPVKDEQHGFNRENHGRILLTDPYYFDDFAATFSSDLRVICGLHEEANRNHKWTQMPRIIVIPILAGCHWRSIRVTVNYDRLPRSANILWDDPYGESHFPKYMKDRIRDTLRDSIQMLIRTQIEGQDFLLASENVIEQEKPHRQQNNGWDCGPLTIANCEDYIKTNSNDEFVTNVDLYSIKDTSERRTNDKETFCTISGQRPVPEHIHIRQQQQASQFKVFTNVSRIHQLSGDWIKLIYNVVYNNRLEQGIDLNTAYTDEEIDAAYKYYGFDETKFSGVGISTMEILKSLESPEFQPPHHVVNQSSMSSKQIPECPLVHLHQDAEVNTDEDNQASDYSNTHGVSLCP
jgi:hypothetical protein